MTTTRRAARLLTLYVIGYNMSTATRTRNTRSAVEEFREQVRKQMEERELSISQLARDLGMSRPFLSRVISGQQMPSIDVADKIARKLGLRLTTEVL